MSLDINDRAVAKELPDDIKELCKPANEAARIWDDKNPRVRTVQDLLKASLARALSVDKPKALTTCNWKLNHCTGGIRPGHVWVLGADTNWGKTAWIVAVTDENMDMGARVLIVSTEDDESIYGDRLLARRSRVSATNLRDRCLNPVELKEVCRTVNDSLPKPVFLDARGVAVENLCVKIRSAIEKHHIDLVCIDYLQEVKTDTRYQDERVKFREIASQLRCVIKGAKISGIIASQLTINGDDKEPTKHSIRESRDVSNAAEVVILGYTSQVDAQDDKGNTVVRVGDKVMKVDKAKDGWKRQVAMEWDSHSACFNRQLQPLSAAEEAQAFVGFEPDNEVPPPAYSTDRRLPREYDDALDAI